MGTDIHIFIERRTPAGWVLIRGEHEFFDDEGIIDFDLYWADKGWTALDTRNYALFSILSDQRNHGPKRYIPIAHERGLPDDISDKLRAIMDDSLEHSPSWLMLNEITGYDWERVRSEHSMADGWLKRWFAALESEVLSLGDPANLRMVFYYDS